MKCSYVPSVCGLINTALSGAVASGLGLLGPELQLVNEAMTSRASSGSRFLRFSLRKFMLGNCLF